MLPPPDPASGRFDGPVHRYALRVFYEDTDLSGVVYHANYLRWFERARSDLLRLIGIDQRAAAENGAGFYAVAGMDIAFRAPARLDDTVLVETTVGQVGAASAKLVQRALREGALLCEAQVRVGFVGPDLRPRRQPSAWRAAFVALMPEAAPVTSTPEG
jgi:acyl-CoA thioester hydrolase